MAANNLDSTWSSMKTIASLQEAKDSNHITPDGFSSETEFKIRLLL